MADSDMSVAASVLGYAGLGFLTRCYALGLQKRTSRKTFDGDAVAIAAARDETRRRFKAAAQETDATKIDEGLKMGDEIVSVLRQNVVQGKWKQDRNAYGKFRYLQPVTTPPSARTHADIKFVHT